METLPSFTEGDVRAVLARTIRVLAVLTVVGMVVVGFKLGWRSSVLLLVGAAISATGLWEWMRLMSAIMERVEGDVTVRPMGMVLTGFFLRMGLTIAVLYVSLKFLHGSVIALAVGLGLGIAALLFEVIRLARAWTV
jgi:ATP synthase I chain